MKPLKKLLYYFFTLISMTQGVESQCRKKDELDYLKNDPINILMWEKKCKQVTKT